MSHISPANVRDSIVLSITRSAETDNNKIALCASLELASCRAENCQLKQKLTECEATIQSLRQMVATIADKQLQILGEVVEMRKENRAAAMTPPGISTLDSSTSTVLDDIPDWDGYMPDTDSDDWDSPVSSQSSRAFSPYISPLGTSDSGDSEPEMELVSELEDIPASLWGGNGVGDSEPEMELVSDMERNPASSWRGNNVDEEDEGPSPLPPVSQRYQADNWQYESDN